MALQFNLTDHWTDGKRIHVIGNIVASGNYIAGGDTLSLVNTEIKCSPSSLPEFVVIEGQAIYGYKFVPGTTQANGKVKVISGGAELGAGAYPGGLTGDTIVIYAIFPKFI